MQDVAYGRHGRNMLFIKIGSLSPERAGEILRKSVKSAYPTDSLEVDVCIPPKIECAISARKDP